MYTGIGISGKTALGAKKPMASTTGQLRFGEKTLAPQVGLEPTTLRLTAGFQAICPELPEVD